MYDYDYGTAERMPFGKHRGKRLTEVPVSYLRWVLENCHSISLHLRARIRETIDEAEEEFRQDAYGAGPTSNYPPPADLPALLTQAHRELARQYHPDRGGNVDVMKGINVAFDRLKELAGV